MKRFYVDERFFSIGDQFDVYDESGSVAYFVSQKIFSFGKQYNVYDKNNMDVAFIKQKLFNFMPKYELYIDNDIAATVNKKFTLFYSSYDIQSKFGDFTIDGDFFSWNFSVMEGGRTVIYVHKDFTFFKDKYEIQVANDIDEVFAVSLVIVLDAIHHDNHHNH